MSLKFMASQSYRIRMHFTPRLWAACFAELKILLPKAYKIHFCIAGALQCNIFFLLVHISNKGQENKI